MSMKPELLRDPAQLSVTDARRLFGLTGRALRFYEEIGLVSAHRNRYNARWYDPAGRRRLEWISRLRGYVPLHHIAEVLRLEELEPGRGRQFALDQLNQRRVVLEDELAGLEARMAEVCGPGEVGGRARLHLVGAPQRLERSRQ